MADLGGGPTGNGFVFRRARTPTGFITSNELYALLILVPFSLWFLLASYSVVYRYKNISTATEKQQIKWTIAGILGSYSLIIPFSLIAVFYPATQPSLNRIAFIFLVHYPFYVISYLCIPWGVAFAILRYRLWDIDLIIRRTLGYSLLTILLGLLYFGSVTILQGVFTALGGVHSPLITVVTTLLVAAVFNPLRKRTQIIIDRRFYRNKCNAEKALGQFAAKIRDEVVLDQLAGAMIGLINETMQPEQLSIWMSVKGRNGDDQV